MKGKKLILLLILGSILFCFSSGDATASRRKLVGISPRGKVPKSVIIRFRSQKAMRSLAGKLKKAHLKKYRRFPIMAMVLSGREAAKLARDPAVLSVEPDINFQLHIKSPYLRLPLELRKGRFFNPKAGPDDSWGVTPSHEYEPYGLAMMGVTGDFHRRGYLGQGVKVGIIDTGVDSAHPDLHVAGGWNFYATSSPMYGDVLGHGTHVAGIIGARKNGYGVVGMAPQVEIYSLRAFDILGHASLSAILDCIQWAIDYRLDILNMSFGSSTYSPAMKEALERAHEAGILLVASAGNEGGRDSVAYPAKLDFVVAVSAIDNELKIADFSSRGPEVEVAAPGVDILSTFTFPPHYEHFYDVLSGTSMAAPHVAGLAALIKSANRGISSEELRRRLQQIVVDIGPRGRDNDYGYGLPVTDRLPSTQDRYSPNAVAGGPYRGVIKEPVEFKATWTLDKDDNFLWYSWDFGDGASGQGPVVKHGYLSPGTYTVTLTATDQDGLSGSSSSTVEIGAGVDNSVALGAAEAGYVNESTKRMGGRILAGVRSSRTHYLGVVRFDTPRSDDLMVLSAELTLTVTTRSPKDEGTIIVGLLPYGIVENWSLIEYSSLSQAETITLEDPVVMSYLHNQVKEGAELRFRIPHDQLDRFEEQFARGAVAFRVELQTELSNNVLSWGNPTLHVRYLDRVSTRNMGPVADAGFDRRAAAGSVVVLDGSASHDPEGQPLTFRWQQVEGPYVGLQTGDETFPVATFTVPSEVDDVVTFELEVSDGTHTATDRVKIFLNDAPPEIHEVVIVPGYGKAGYVNDEDPQLNFFDKRTIVSGVLSRWKTKETTTVHGQTIHVGVLQFDLNAIPPGSQITLAYLELTGVKRPPDQRSSFDVVVLEDSVDHLWEDLDYEQVVGAEAIATIDTLSRYELDEGKVNKIRIPSSILEARRATTGKVTFRIDGPTFLYGSIWEWFAWWSGNEALTAHMGPRLVVKYGAMEPVEVPLPEEDNPPIPRISGPSSASPGEEVQFTFSATDPDGDQVDLIVDWGDSTVEDLGSFSSGSEVKRSHSWRQEGTYMITLDASDEEGLTSSTHSSILIRTSQGGDDNPPAITHIDGPDTGYAGIDYTFNVTAADPDGDKVRIRADWGDGSTHVTEFFPGDPTISISHSWAEPGTYIVTVTAEDEKGTHSVPLEWSIVIRPSEGEELVISDIHTGTWYLGRTYGSSRQAQSFMAAGSSIIGVSLALSMTGQPAGSIRVGISRRLVGAPLAAVYIYPSDVTSSDPENPSWVTVYFPEPVNVREGSGYYLLLDVSGTDGENHYRIGYNQNNPYPYGVWYPNRNNTRPNRRLDMVCKILFGP